MKIKTCKHCEIEFDAWSQRKQAVGGYINVCADCTEERQQEKRSVIRAFTTGEGKMACIQFLEFESEADANAYARIWESNRGWNNRRSGGLNSIRFRKVGENSGNQNHKGRL